MAQQRQGRRWQVQAATTVATGLTCFIFRFLRRPLYQPFGFAFRKRNNQSSLYPKHTGRSQHVPLPIQMHKLVHYYHLHNYLFLIAGLALLLDLVQKTGPASYGNYAAIAAWV